MIKKKPDSVISSIKNDIDNLITEEFYDRCRTPSYATRIIDDDIENNPIIESYLLQHDLICMTSSDRCNMSHSQSGRPFSSPSWTKGALVPRKPVTNKLHIYLVPTEIVNTNNSNDDMRLGRPTRATLLKERMNWAGMVPHNSTRTQQGERSCLKYKMNDSGKMRFGSSISSSLGCNNGVSYAFMVGGRYTKANFFESNPAIRKEVTQLKDSVLSESTTKSEIITIDSLPSPPNSPHSSNIGESTKIPTTKRAIRANHDFTTIEPISLLPVDDKIEKKSISSVKSSIRTYTRKSANSQSFTVSFKPSVLPTVTGHKCSSIENTGNTILNSIPKTNWTRASLNLHFARQTRNLRNRRQDLSNENIHRKPLNMAVVNHSTAADLSHQHTNEYCVKCISSKIED